MRNIQTVIAEMLKHVPESESPFRRELKRKSYLAAYTAPECMKGVWDSLGQTVNFYVKPPFFHDWKEKVLCIFCDDEHLFHGKGDESGPDYESCPCTRTEKQSECAEAGCGFCIAARNHA